MKVKTKVSSGPMLSWQYRTLIAELSHVTLHASDDSCPCNQVDLDPPEYCLAKHCLNVSSLAAETALMDADNSELLDTLSGEALEQHEKAKTIYCKGGEWPDLARWSRDWRKRIEPLYYRCSTKGNGRKAVTAEDVAELFEKPHWKLIGRHNWVSGALITETYREDDDSIRRFVATIRGWRNFHIYEGKLMPNTGGEVIAKVKLLRDRIDRGEDVADVAETPLTISGTCSPADRTCGFKVKSTDTTEAAAQAVRSLGAAIKDVAQRAAAKTRPGVVATDKTWAMGITKLTRYQFQLKVVDAKDLVVSHDPWTFDPNPAYIQILQPRLRERAVNKLQVENIATHLEPDLLLLDYRSIDKGTPIVGPMG